MSKNLTRAMQPQIRQQQLNKLGKLARRQHHYSNISVWPSEMRDALALLELAENLPVGDLLSADAYHCSLSNRQETETPIDAQGWSKNLSELAAGAKARAQAAGEPVIVVLGDGPVAFTVFANGSLVFGDVAMAQKETKSGN